MTHAMILERACRAGAMVIAVVAVIDPQWVVAREAPDRVVLSKTAGATEADLERVKDALTDAFQVETEASPSTAIRVVVGRTPPATPDEGLTFVVAPNAADDVAEIRAVAVADESSLDAVGRVTVTLAVPAQTRATSLTLSLLADGVPVETLTDPVGPAAGSVVKTLSFIPSRVGLARLRVSARLGEGPESHADVATEVSRRTLRVLFYDARPSWAATFLRRTLEEDPRLDVVVRSMTSRGVAADAGAPPASLDRAEDLAAFDLVVVSTPEGLSDRAAAALETYLRNREGAVVLLPGEQTAPVLARLTGVSNWTVERRPALGSVTAPAGSWTASEFLWPGRLPQGAEALTGCLSPDRCAVWRVPLGGGRVIVSSALDGWRTRGAESSAFAAFWRSIVGDEATATLRPIEIALRSRTVEPNALVSARIETASTAGTLRAEWQNIEGTVQPVRLWPTSGGGYSAEFRAPDAPGRYRLVVKTSGVAATETRAEFLVVEAGQLQSPVPGSVDLLSAFASSRGGALVPISDVESLPARIAAAVTSTASPTPTNPMRSPFWTFPFAGLLAIEWWSRRRRGAR